MKFGMMVDLSRGVDFLKDCTKAGIENIKLVIPPNTHKAVINAAFKRISDHGHKAYLVLNSIKQTPVQRDPIFQLHQKSFLKKDN